MYEQVISTSSLQPLLSSLIHSEKVRVRESNSVVTIEPIYDVLDCPLLGAASGSKLSVDSFLKMKHEEHEVKILWIR